MRWTKVGNVNKKNPEIYLQLSMCGTTGGEESCGFGKGMTENGDKDK